MEAFWWLFAIVLMALGLIGTVIPIVPGTTIILAAAVVHRLVLGADRSLGWSALIAMLVLTLLTYAIDAAAGYLGAKRFGATKWGLIGGAAGALIGLIFWLVRALCRPGDRRDRGRTYWRKRNHESWSRGLGHVSGRFGRCYRETFHRAHYDCDLSDERAIAVIRQALSSSVIPSAVDGFRGESFKVAPRDPSAFARDDQNFCCQPQSFVLQSYFDAPTRAR